MKKGKMFKKSISCLLAALMIIASMPFSAISASAADNTLTVASNTILCAGDTDRWKDTSSGTNSKLQITNDGQAGNFSYAIWQYKISDLRSVLKHSDKQLESAKVSYVLSGAPSNGVNPKLTFAYSTTYDELFSTISSGNRTGRTEFITDISKRNTDENVGGTYRADCLKSWYGLNEIETKTVSSSQSLEVDYAAAINDAVNKGLDYFTVFAYQPQRANTDRNNTWSDINLYNRDYSISYTTKDAYTSTSSYNLTEVKKGALVYTDTNRWPGGNIARVVNDQRNDNCSIGYLRFSVSNFTDIDNIASAVYDFTDTIDSTEREAMGLTVSYATQNDDSLFNTYGNNPTTSTGIFKSGSKETANTDFINSSKNYFGLQTLATYSTTVGDANKSRKVDLAPAIKWAVNANKSYVVIAFMLSYPGGSNENNTNNQTKFWSDTDVNLSSSALSITKVSNSLDVDVSQVKANVDSFNGYSSSYSPQINSKNVEAHNVLYSQNGTDFTTNAIEHSSPGGTIWSWYASFKIRYYIPNMTLLYDGTQPYNTILFNATAKDDGCKDVYMDLVYPANANGSTVDSSDFALYQLWEGSAGSFGVPTSSDRQVGYSSSTRYGTQTYSYGTNYVLKNKLYYTGNPNSTLTSINTMYWRSRADARGVSTINGTHDSSANGRQAEGTDTIGVNINIVNIKELKTIAENLKSGKVEEFNKLLESKEYYGDEAKVNAYLKAVNDVVTFNPNYYFSSSTNDYQGCANAIDALVSRYNRTRSELVRRYKVTFRYANNNIAEVKYANSGDTVSTSLPNTATFYSQISGNNVNHEKTIYSWTTATVASSDIEVKESVKTENVAHNGTYNKDVKDEEGKNSKHSFVCSDCNYSYTDYHNFIDSATCTCGAKVDEASFEAAKQEAGVVLTQSSLYEDTSYKNFSKTVTDAGSKRSKGELHCQDDFDKATCEILYAKTLLKKKTGTVTIKVYDQNNQEITDAGNTYTKDYGTEITIAPETEQNVYKYVIEKDGATSEIYGQQSISYVVTGDATVKAYCNKAQSADEKYTKVTFLVGGKISDIKYVKANETLDTSKANKLQFPFFTTGKWDTDSVAGSADISSVTVRAELTPVGSDTCGVYIPGNDGNYTAYQKKYDEKVDVKDYGLDDSSDYALSKSSDPKDIIAYMHGTVFYAPARKEVYVIPVNKGESSKDTKVNTVGTFTSVDDKNKYVGFNCKFSLAEGCTPVEWGITFIPMNANYRPVDENGNPTTSTVFRIKTHSKENEYAATLSLSKNSTKYSAIRAKAYLKYKDANNKVQVTYGDEYVQAFGTENKFGITDIKQNQN